MAYSDSFKNNQIILDGFDFTIDEGNNAFVALRKVKWSETGTPRLDLRKYVINSNGEEEMKKGVGMITEEGPHELARVLVEQGYGHTGDLIVAMRTRDDFVKELVDKYLDTSYNEEIDPELTMALKDSIEDVDAEELYDLDDKELYDLEEEGLI